MDPNANLQEQERLIELRAVPITDDDQWWRTSVSSERRDLRELRQALAGWIRGGGFEPDWSKAPRAAKYYHR